jgi:hypothetical protein
VQVRDDPQTRNDQITLCGRKILWVEEMGGNFKHHNITPKKYKSLTISDQFYQLELDYFDSYWKNQASFGQIKHILQKHIPVVEMWIKELEIKLCFFFLYLAELYTKVGYGDQS